MSKGKNPDYLVVFGNESDAEKADTKEDNPNHTRILYIPKSDAGGKKELNPLELSDRMMERLSDPARRSRFARTMGWVTFAVGLVQGLTAFAFSARKPRRSTGSPWALPSSPSPRLP